MDPHEQSDTKTLDSVPTYLRLPEDERGPVRYAILADFQPQTALVLGSGLSSFVDRMEVSARIPYKKLGLPSSGVPGHDGSLVLGTIGSARLAVLSGRVHLYEGRSTAEITAGLRLLHQHGVPRIILTNAAGTLNPDFPPGDWMALTDHLNLTGSSPLTGGPNFVDMSEVYTSALRQQFVSAAEKAGIPLHQGVYAGLCGPQYETPAEVRMLRTLGADAVGMSTVLEAIAARALNMEVAAFSCLTNWAAGLSGPLSHGEVMDTGKAAAGQLVDLLSSVLPDLSPA